MQAKERGRWFEWPPRSRSLFPLDARRRAGANCEPPLLWSGFVVATGARARTEDVASGRGFQRSQDFLVGAGRRMLLGCEIKVVWPWIRKARPQRVAAALYSS